VLRYPAFDAVPVRVRSWIIWRWLWEKIPPVSGQVWRVARSALSRYFGIGPRA